MSFDWTTTTLGQICDAQGGAIQTGPFGSQLHTSDYTETGIPVVMPTNIGDGGIVEDGIARIAQADVDRLSQHILRLDDIVFSRRGDVTKNALIRPHEVGWFCGTGCLKVRLGSGAVADAKFISHCLRLPETKDWLIRHAVGATMPNLNTGILSAVPIFLPPLHVQLDIAAMLGAFDDRITLLRETNATLEGIAQALFKSWFVDFDPVRAKMEGRTPEGMDEATAALFPDGLEDSELGLVPKGWQAVRLDDLCKRYGGSIQTGPFGSQLHASDYVETGIPVVMPKDIQNRRAMTDSIARIGVADADRLSRHKVMAGDIVFSRRGDVEKHALMTEREVGWICGTGCLLLRPGKAWPSATFLSMTLDAPRARVWLVQHAVGATMPNINTGILGSVPVILPSEAVLMVFEDVIAACELQRSHNASTAETLATLRDTLLPRLISGQLRLPQVHQELEAALP
ncbi:type I restriction enzyme S subunit [Rhodoferax ferrireducens]|uniref:Type I restriction enzyme S subunit n=1 Tax=Rhodoferax ferrireducens TaxID=192843 RepID=A0ABU2C262_9BURK|nr:restriction endonuclease subunit S [Rhodoferax ferrireducens]MDR7375421.1 type I restriction enzyme S subunit [Rhodoferax ferrireducens]